MKEVYESEKYVHIVMEILQDGELSQLIDNGFLSERDSTKLIHQTLSAVEYLNMCGIAHCDIKPSNIMIKNLVNIDNSF